VNANLGRVHFRGVGDSFTDAFFHLSRIEQREPQPVGVLSTDEGVRLDPSLASKATLQAPWMSLSRPAFLPGGLSSSPPRRAKEAAALQGLTLTGVQI